MKLKLSDREWVDIRRGLVVITIVLASALAVVGYKVYTIQEIVTANATR